MKEGKIYITQEGMDALDHAINVKWYEICFKGLIDTGIRDCRLCKVYYLKECEGCPIKKYTGDGGCTGTPYGKWAECTQTWVKVANNPERMRAALNFYEWLIELRKKCEVMPPPGRIVYVTKGGMSTADTSYYTKCCSECGRVLKE